MENKTGAKTVPWGAPVFVTILDETKKLSLVLTKTNCGLLVKNSKTKRAVRFVTPICSNFGIKICG